MRRVCRGASRGARSPRRVDPGAAATKRTAVGKRAGNRADEPGRAQRRPADHHTVRARLRHHGARIFDRRAIAVDDDRNCDRVDDRARRPPIGPTVVELSPRAPVNRHHPAPARFGAAGEIGRIQRTLIPAETHLHRDGNRDRVDDRGDDPLGAVEIAHQRRPRQCARHAPRRTAHVDVDDLSPRAFDPARRLGHRDGLAADELDGMGRDPLALGAHRRFGVALEKGLGGDHFGKDERRAEAARDPTHRQVADAGHRREHRDAVQRDRPKEIGAAVLKVSAILIVPIV